MNYSIHDEEDSIHFVSLFDHVLTGQKMLNLQLCGSRPLTARNGGAEGGIRLKQVLMDMKTDVGL